MRTVNMHEAKTHLSRRVDQAAKGEPFVIAKQASRELMMRETGLTGPTFRIHTNGPKS